MVPRVGEASAGRGAEKVGVCVCVLLEEEAAPGRVVLGLCVCVFGAMLRSGFMAGKRSTSLMLCCGVGGWWLDWVWWDVGTG